MGGKKGPPAPFDVGPGEFIPDAEAAAFVGTKPAAPGPSPEPFEVGPDEFKPDLPPAEPQEEPGLGEAVARGAGQGVTLGFSDELIGLGKALFSDIGGTLSGKDTRGGFGQKYAKERDAEREANRRASDAHGFAYGASELGGGIASSFIPGLGIAKGASLAKTALGAAKLGAVGGLGSSEAEDIPGMLVDAGGSALISGATAGVLHKILAGAPGRSVARKLGDITDGATATQRDRVVGNAGGRVGDVLDVINDKAFKKAGRDAPKLLAVTEDAIEDTGAALDSAFGHAGMKTKGTRVQDVVDDVEKFARELGNDPGKADLARAVQKKADDIRAAWLPKPEKAPKAPRVSSKAIPIAAEGTPSAEMVQEGLPLPGAEEVKRLKRGAGGRFEKDTPLPGYEASGGVDAYQSPLPFGEKAGWLKTTSGKDIGAPTIVKTEPYVTAQQLRVLANDIADTAFAGSPAVAPKQGKATSQQLWGMLKDRMMANLEDAAKEGGPARKEIEQLNKRMSTLLNMREALRYRATREATESTRLKDRISGGVDIALALADPSTFVAKKAYDIVGKPAIRAADDALAQLRLAAERGSTRAQLAERAAMLGLSPLVAQPLWNWVHKADRNLSGADQ